MKPIARKGDLHRCPIPGHGTTKIVSGSPSLVEGQPVARVGDSSLDTHGCGATIIEGASSSTTDGRPTAAARSSPLPAAPRCSRDKKDERRI
ncbi:PAAR domain-containing protein [Vreelandella olivaria]|uniref:PAAR domain-containing protein n=1 Tax=Vreelandella olivaria TaxID=390919 RepID=UPI00201F69FF|nr:PAAR domain-containing protein [Halomonas olivaria]